MKAGKDHFKEDLSSFLSVEKDLSIILEKIMSNQRLLKLLYYTNKDCLKGADLTPAQVVSMINNQIRIVPVVNASEACPNYIVVTFGSFTKNGHNPEFRDNHIMFDIVCNPDHWILNNFQLRPLKIAGELDKMFKDKHLTGIGDVEFYSGSQLLLNRKLAGYCLDYKVVHGVEDQINGLPD